MSDQIKVAVCVPSREGQCRTMFAHSLAGLMGYGNMLRSRCDAESFEMTLKVQESSVIHANREMLVKESLAWGATHIMFLDDDMVFNPLVLEMLLSRRQPFVACNYPKRGWPITFTAVRLDGKGYIITHKGSSGMEEAFYTGFGVSLIERQVFEKTKQPWFLPLYLEKEGVYTTEDNPFCVRVREAGFKVLVDHDASKNVGHVGLHTFDWSQWREPESVFANAGKLPPQTEVLPDGKLKVHGSAGDVRVLDPIQLSNHKAA